MEQIYSVKINPSLVMMREWHTSQNTGKVELVPHSLWKLWAEKLWHRGHLFFRWHGENRRKNETRSQYCRDQQQIQTNTGGPRDFSPRSQQAARCCEIQICSTGSAQSRVNSSDQEFWRKDQAVGWNDPREGGHDKPGHRWGGQPEVGQQIDWGLLPNKSPTI